MSSSDFAVRVQEVGKCYHIYDTPRDRLKQFMLPRMRRLAGLGHKDYYRDFWALRDVSFELRRGEAIGIIGRNGSGKSTLLQVLCGTLSPTTGTVETSGRVAALLELGAGFNPEFTGRENVYMNAALLGLSREQVEARFDSIAAFADIGDFLEQPVKMYSSGMFVRLAFAVIAHVDAEILVIDEALAVGDALFVQKCMRFIRKFREQGTLLYVSHDSASVMNICDRAIWLQSGRVQQQGSAKEVCEAYLEDLFSALDAQAQKQPAVAVETIDAERIERLRQPGLAWRDQRADFLNASNLRNDLEVFRFEERKDAEFGGKDATITNARLLDSNGEPLSWVVGGERVTMRIEAQAHVPVRSPIFGFMLRDRLGQNVFGDNSYLAWQGKPLHVKAGASFGAEFEFYMPWLAQGDYVFQVALAEGTQADHRQLHWIHDAIVVRAHHDAIATGLIGIPMIDIRLGMTEPAPVAAEAGAGERS
ncbi:ABC transporter ATP-binding protein [Ramlibacter sp. USB13]|uniref:ABC transporter ATP-binding protein n=1 Tax=Ramlibacter cellulosilyticus TaxID=2764187 RepID=A0A923SH19_9BURK|nr:ABC transporter ATP-binding protein [Ramlibacter cellulosilyticus]MBC5785487.1 ABC transporter ATP-binding protein [Ramlibacter cellulosilyticus]